MLRFRFLRGSSALAMPLLVLRLALAGGAGACPADEGAKQGAERGEGTPHPAAHAGHEMPPDASHGSLPTPPAGHHHGGTHCDMACTPASCGSASHCTGSAISASATVTVVATSDGRRVVGADASLRSVSTAPEPPPPRA